MRPSAQPFLWMKNYVHIKGKALNFVLIERRGETRKWPILIRCTAGYCTPYLNSPCKQSMCYCSNSSLFYPQNISVMPIRLRGSHSSNMGRIEVHYAGTWGSVRASGWDIKDATVACRQLGYHSASLSGYRIFCSSDIPMWFTSFRCFGNETSLEQCGRDFYQYSSSTYCASVVCADKMTEEGEKYKYY